MRRIVGSARLVDNLLLVGDNSRTHSIVFDQPVASGGTDKGPTPLEVTLIALAGCAVTIYADIAKRSKVELTSLEAVTEAEEPEGSVRLSRVKVKVKVAGKAREKLLEAIWRKTEENCPVLHIFKEPVPVETELETESATEQSQ